MLEKMIMGSIIYHFIAFSYNINSRTITCLHLSIIQVILVTTIMECKWTLLGSIHKDTLGNKNNYAASQAEHN